MSMFQALAAVATMIGIVGSVLLVVRLTAAHNATSPKHLAGPVPEQRSPLAREELKELNRAYGAGQIGEQEYQRRRKELLARVD